MFDTIGRVQDEEAGGRRAKSMAITAAIALVSLGLGVALTPKPGPRHILTEPDPQECHACEAGPEVVESPPEAPAPRAGPAGGGEAPPEELVEPRYLSAVVPNAVVSQGGTGIEQGPGTGPGGEGTGTDTCEGEHCGQGGGDGSRVLHHSQLSILQRVDPEYPREARRMQLPTTRCLADVRIDTRGQVTRVQLLDCPAVFQRATELALMQWRFAPVTTSANDPVPARTQIAITFQR